MAAYVIADIEVVDSAGFAEYQQKVPATIAQYGGRYLIRGGAVETLEGIWSPEYGPLITIRERTTRSNLVIAEGL